jgi:transcription elongation factor Elf1
MERFDNHALELRCPDCERTISKTIGWLKLRRSLNCSWCGTLIAIDRNQFLQDVEKAEQALADLDKYFGKPSG